MSIQVGQSDESSTAGDAAVAVPAVKRAAFVHGLRQQLLCGYAVVLPFLRLGSSAFQSVEPTWVAMTLAVLLIAVGTGFPLQSWIGRAAGLHVAARCALLSVAAGVVTTTIAATPWGIVIGCFFIGLGLFGEWTPAAEMTRRSLSSTQLWRGMRIHGAMFFVGALLVITVDQLGFDKALTTVSSVVALGCVVTAALLRPVRSAELPASPDETLNASCGSELPENNSALSKSSEQQPDDSDADDCDAEECCGGGCEWTPMPVALGACLAFVAMYALGVVVAGTATQGSGIPAMIGALVGFALFQAVVPTAGYAVLLVSCCLLGMIVFGIAPWIGSSWQGALFSVQGGFAAAIYCGGSGLTGESFADSCQGNSRTTVLMIGSMAAAAVSLVQGVVQSSISPTIASLMNAAVCLVAILFLRRIPSVIVSQRRQDEVPSKEAEEMLAETFGAAGGSLK